MVQVRIDVADLARELDGALAHLAAGDEVLLEREGTVVAELAGHRPEDGHPEPPTEDADDLETGIIGFLRQRARDGRWPDEEYDAFIRDLEQIREWLNEPPRYLWD